jgi:WD domain, G-beta repeat.
MKLLNETQETVLQGHTSAVRIVVVTSDNKYVISGSDDYSIRI